MRPEKILVVDDEKRIVDNIARCLNREGFDVTGAHDGSEAVALFEHQRFDLILLDISMPGMNGYEVMEHIFGLDGDVLIIIMTGFASVESAVKALKKGAWDYLKKPFEYTDLIKTVKNALAQSNLLAEKKAVSARLEASERQYKYMVNNSPDLVFTLDTNGCFTFVNDQFERLLGFSRKVLVGSLFEDLVHKGDRERVRELVASGNFVQEGTDGHELNFRFKRASRNLSHYDPHGAFAHMELKASPMYLPASETRKERKGVYAVARDVTERVILEAQLRQAQKMEAIGTLAGGIAHDFNNILMGIQGYASLVKCGFDRDSEEFKRLSNIDEYVSNGAEMARHLLGFAQKSCHEVSMINLNYLLKMSAKMFGRTKKDIIIDQYLEKKLWGTIVDEGQIKQVLMNLFVNAWQAMSQGGKITIKSENVRIDESRIDEFGFEAPGAFVKITVADTGMGMDKETMSRIFDPFFTTKARGQGTGLGLATAYGIIKSHRGAFKVDSKPGRGSSFMFFLPAEDTLVECDPTVEQDDKIINGKGRILLVDDEKGVIEVCFEMLEALGYEVKVATSGMEAIKIMDREGDKIDLVILDMVMPGMNGLETYEVIRRIRPDTRVLVSSGYSREEDLNRMMEKGCNDFILKPFDVAMLSEKLRGVFNPLEKV
ncbi:MAG: response regulator [Proteobacteria bacterium]|nr:response regulator [Desulfobacula sp.]MBU3953330.1 response regulator [Pseudomonadota bacterium]MBU4133144.1 response regulator [Pseudomonadota bacterium]